MTAIGLTIINVEFIFYLSWFWHCIGMSISELPPFISEKEGFRTEGSRKEHEPLTGSPCRVLFLNRNETWQTCRVASSVLN